MRWLSGLFAVLVIAAQFSAANAQNRRSPSGTLGVYLNEPGYGSDRVVRYLKDIGVTRVHLFLNDATYGKPGTECSTPFAYAEPWTERKIRDYVALLKKSQITPVLTLAPNRRSKAFMESVKTPVKLASELGVAIEFDLEGAWLKKDCLDASANFTQLELLKLTRELAPNSAIGISVPHYHIEEYWPFISAADFIAVQAYGKSACQPAHKLEQKALDSVVGRFRSLPHQAEAQLWITIAADPGNCDPKTTLQIADAITMNNSKAVPGVLIWSWRALVRNESGADYLGLPSDARLPADTLPTTKQVAR